MIQWSWHPVSVTNSKESYSAMVLSVWTVLYSIQSLSSLDLYDIEQASESLSALSSPKNWDNKDILL